VAVDGGGAAASYGWRPGMSWYDEHGNNRRDVSFKRPISDKYLPSRREGRRPEPKEPPRSAARAPVDWWDQLERRVGGRLNDDQRALAEYLKAGGHNVPQTRSLLVTSQMEQPVYRRRDGVRSWAFCEVLGMSAAGMRVISFGVDCAGVRPSDVVTLRQMVEEDEHLKHDPELAKVLRLRTFPTPPLHGPGDPLDHPVHKDRRSMTWLYCSVAPGTREDKLLVRLPYGHQFESAAKYVTTLREMIDADDDFAYDAKGLREIRYRKEQEERRIQEMRSKVRAMSRELREKREQRGRP
jgi:hypothetical protein